MMLKMPQNFVDLPGERLVFMVTPGAVKREAVPLQRNVSSTSVNPAGWAARGDVWASLLRVSWSSEIVVLQMNLLDSSGSESAPASCPLCGSQTEAETWSCREDCYADSEGFRRKRKGQHINLQGAPSSVSSVTRAGNDQVGFHESSTWEAIP